MRRALLLLILIGGISIMPTASFSQGKKGFGGQFDPDEMFNRLSGGKDVIVISELDPQKQGMVKMMAQRFNLTGDRISRQQYKTAMEGVTKLFQKDGGGGPPQGPGGQMRIGGGPGGFGPGGFRGPSGAPGAPQVPPPPGPMANSSSSGNGPSRDGGNRDSDIDTRAERSFRERDKDNDGLLRFEEMSDQLQTERDTYDADKNGFIDLAEYKAYMRVRMARKDNPQATDKPANPEEKKTPENNTPVVIDTHQPYKEDPRPQIFRVGKLPKELPEWFARLDKLVDSDGQVGLYEWKLDGKSIDEFNAMDLNGDGLLTADRKSVV